MEQIIEQLGGIEKVKGCLKLIGIMFIIALILFVGSYWIGYTSS